jgi:hypothetical protein
MAVVIISQISICRSARWYTETLPLTQYCSGDQIEKNEIGGACGTYGERRGVYRGLVRKPVGKNHLEYPGVEERIILRWIFIKWGLGHGMD